MPTERTFDYDYLRRTLREHPEWSYRQVARAVTENERVCRNDPSYPPVSVHAIASVKMRYRDTWAENGTVVTDSKMSPVKRTQPFSGLPMQYWHNYLIQNLRILVRLANGQTELGKDTAKKAREAELLAARLDRTKSVIDVDFRGEPYIREARPDERDQEGNLLPPPDGYWARYPGLSGGQWAALKTPEARAAASAHWRGAVS